MSKMYLTYENGKRDIFRMRIRNILKSLRKITALFCLDHFVFGIF